MIPILVRQINDLTTARYFAAKEVEIMSFLISTDLSKIQEIKEWIEGPSIAIEATKLDDIDKIKHYVEALGAKFIISEDHLPFENLIQVVRNGNQHYSLNHVIYKATPNEELTFLNEKNFESRVFIEHDNLNDFDINQYHKPHLGISIYAGKEDQTGLKSFDEIDQLFDKIEGV